MKKNMINKSNVLKVCLLVFFASMLPILNASAQKKLYYANSGAPIEVGDSVRINPDSLRYETGERKLKWVYDQVHEIRQVSSKYHPDAVLLRGIYSWIYVNSILPENEAKKPHPDPVFTSFDVTVEFGQTYTWNDLTYDSTGVYTQQFQAATGADSIVTLNLTVLPKPLPQPYQVNRLSFGLRGGFASTLASSKGVPAGFDALLDLRYAHYWVKDQGKILFGIMTGLSAGYVLTRQQTTFLDEYTAPTVDGDVFYHISADKVVEKNHQVQLEVPVLFSMVTPKGFFLNAGPKLVLPVYSQYHQQLTNPTISAYLAELDGHPITNEVVMGAVTGEQADLRGKMVDNPCKLMSLALTAELGYEFKFKNGHSLDLGVYADYSVYNLYRTENTTGKIVSLTPPTKTSAAIVTVQPISSAFANKYGFVDAGLKLTYNLDFIK